LNSRHAAKPNMEPSDHIPRPVAADWAIIASENERKERKKIQNCLNQRSRRQRSALEKPSKQSFRIVRWRATDDVLPAPSLEKAKRSSTPAEPNKNIPGLLQRPHAETLSSYLNSDALVPFNQPLQHLNPGTIVLLNHGHSRFKNPPSTFPLSSDHLLHLIHYNVFRGLIANKSVLRSTTTLLSPIGITTPFAQDKFCEGYAVIQPLPNENPPAALVPTPLQMQHPHTSWINIFPVPQIRDRLIRFYGIYDEEDLFADMVGEMFPSYSGPGNPDSAGMDDEEPSDDVTSGRRCLIVWGEPWEVSSWEVTPGYAKKWGWLLHGCKELMESTNRWRLSRCENPIEFMV